MLGNCFTFSTEDQEQNYSAKCQDRRLYIDKGSRLSRWLNALEQVSNPLNSHRHSVWLTHVLDALEETGFLYTSVLHHEHGIFDWEELVKHSLDITVSMYPQNFKCFRMTYVDQKQSARWLINDTILEERESRPGVKLHLLNIIISELQCENLSEAFPLISLNANRSREKKTYSKGYSMWLATSNHSGSNI
jgi:hypothetical protein